MTKQKHNILAVTASWLVACTSILSQYFYTNVAAVGVLSSTATQSQTPPIVRTGNAPYGFAIVLVVSIMCVVFFAAMRTRTIQDIQAVE